MLPQPSFWCRLIIFILQYTIQVCYSYREDGHSQATLFGQNDDSGSKSSGFLDGFAYTTTTDESKLRLAFLVDDKIDKNKDGEVQLDELVSWLRECQDKYAQEDVNRHWISFGKSLDDERSLSWEEYSSKEYDHLISLTRQTDNKEQVEGIKRSHENLVRKDLRRWAAADSDNNNRLSKAEYKSFLHPEHSESMHQLLLEEKFETLDDNKDGRISLDEYLADLSGEEIHYFDTKQRDDWSRKERVKFEEKLDLDRDNYLNKSEFAIWFNKSELNDHSVAEAQHLMRSSDLNRDHRLSKEEILLAYHEFVNSHATDFGEALRSHKKTIHDEL